MLTKVPSNLDEARLLERGAMTYNDLDIRIWYCSSPEPRVVGQRVTKASTVGCHLRGRTDQLPGCFIPLLHQDHRHCKRTRLTLQSTVGHFAKVENCKNIVSYFIVS